MNPMGLTLQCKHDRCVCVHLHDVVRGGTRHLDVHHSLDSQASK